MKDLAVKREISPQSIIYYYISKIPRCMILMLIGLVIAFAFSIYSVNHVNSSFKFISEADLNVGLAPKFINIFLHNITVALIMIMGHMFGKYISKIMLIINGAFLGIVISSYFIANVSKVILLSLLPHSIIEIPALLLSASFGIYKEYKFERMEYIKLFLIIIFMFMFAAMLEVNISYPLANYLENGGC